jgi:tetratricopeptide (TPR) repeat protein
MMKEYRYLFVLTFLNFTLILTMEFSDRTLPLIYLVAFLVLLAIAGFFVIRQILKTRRVENALNRLETKLKSEAGTTEEYYELGSIYLDKKLFIKANTMLQKAIKAETIDPAEFAPIYNALGYSYFAQEQYDLAIKQYKKAIDLEPEYVMALNNLGHAYEQKKLTTQALEIYERALQLDDGNTTAKRRTESLRRRVVVAS